MTRNDYAIRIRNLGKKYNLGEHREKYLTFREALTNTFVAPVRRLYRKDLAPQEFWALKNISFDIERGEIIGIIGRNGAGKSTLLKILSRITHPSEGSAEIYGRVGSLLEVGTGFHPELTGQENIYLSGSILGMRKKEIEEKFEEIVKFAEVEKFIDTPVKRFSSGMYVRLAFAVASYLETEILLVDEVLAVGDAAFQKKCLNKMGDVANEGRTILFVSHNMSAVANLCTKAVLLNSGSIESYGTTRDIIDRYLSKSVMGASYDLTQIPHEDRPRKYATLTSLSLFDENNRPTYTYYMGHPLIVRIGCKCKNPLEDAEIGFKITSRQGNNIHLFPSVWEGFSINLEKRDYLFELIVPKICLYPGKYFIGCWISKPGEHSDDLIQEIGLIEILSNDITGYSPTFDLYALNGTEVYCPGKWKLINQKEYNF